MQYQIVSKRFEYFIHTLDARVVRADDRSKWMLGKTIEDVIKWTEGYDMIVYVFDQLVENKVPVSLKLENIRFKRRRL